MKYSDREMLRGFGIDDLGLQTLEVESDTESGLGPALTNGNGTIPGEERVVYGDDDVEFLNRIERVEDSNRFFIDTDVSRCWFRKFIRKMGSSPIEMQCKRCYNEKRTKPTRGCGYLPG